MGFDDSNKDATSRAGSENASKAEKTDAVVKNPNPRANENIETGEKTATGTVTGSEITDGEDA